MSTVDITTGSASGGGDQPPNNDPEYEFDELAPIEDDDEQEAQMRTKTLIDPPNTNREETVRETAAIDDLRVKWNEKRLRALDMPDETTFESQRIYDAAKREHERLTAAAAATNAQYASEIATLNVERDDLKAELDVANMSVKSLKSQLTEAETVRKERREELLTFHDVEQIEQQEAVEAAQQQQQPTQQGDSSQSQQPSSHDDQTPQQQFLLSSHQQPPPPQLSGVQLQQQTPTSVTQQTDVPSTADATNIQAGTSIQSTTLTEAALSRAEPMDQTLPNRGPPSSSNEPMSLEQSSESTSTHDDHMKSLDASFEQTQTNASLPTGQNYGSVLDNYPQSGFDPLVRTEAPSPAESAATLLYQHNLFRHNAENSAFHSAATSPYGSSNLNASTGPTDSSQPLYNEMLQIVQAAAALAPDNSQQPANDERQNLAISAANIMDRLRLQPDGNLGWPAQQTPAQPQHPANMSSGQLPYAPPVSGYTAMGSQLQRQQSAPYLQHQQQQVTPQQHQQMVIQQQLQQQMPYQQQLLAVQQQQHQQVIPQQQRMSTPQLYQSSWLQQPSHYAVPEINPGQLHQQGLVPPLPQFQHSTPLHSRPTTPSQQFPQAPQGAYGNFAMPGMLPLHPSLPQQYPGQQLQPVQQQYAPQPQVMPQQHQAAPQQWNAHQQPAQLHQATPQQVEPPYQVAPPVWNIPTTTAANSVGDIPTTTTSILHVQVSPETEQKYREELNIIMAQLEKNAKVYDKAKVTERGKLAVISQLEEEQDAEDNEATDFDADGKGMAGLDEKLTAALKEHHYVMKTLNSASKQWTKLAGKRKAFEDILAACKTVPQPEESVTPLSQVLSTPPTTPHQGSTSKHPEPEVGHLIDVEEVTGGDQGNNIEDSQTDVDPGVWIQPPRDRFKPLPDPSHYQYFPEEDDAMKPHNPLLQSEHFSPVIANHGLKRWEPVLRYLIRERAYPGISPTQYDRLLRYIATKLQAECGKVFENEYDQFCTPDPAIVIIIGFNRILRATSKIPVHQSYASSRRTAE